MFKKEGSREQSETDQNEAGCTQGTRISAIVIKKKKKRETKPENLGNIEQPIAPPGLHFLFKEMGLYSTSCKLHP